MSVTLTSNQHQSATKSIQSAPLALQSISHIHCCDGLPLGMLRVGDGVPDNVLQEDLDDTPGLFIDQARDSLNTTPASQPSDSWLGDALDIITQHHAMFLGASLSQSFTTSSQ